MEKERRESGEKQSKAAAIEAAEEAHQEYDRENL